MGVNILMIDAMNKKHFKLKKEGMFPYNMVMNNVIFMSQYTVEKEATKEIVTAYICF